MSICKYFRLKYVIMGKNGPLCKIEVIMSYNDVIIGAYVLYNR